MCAVKYGVPKTLTTAQWDRLAKRLAAKIDKSAGPDHCWPFKGCIHKVGYGRITVIAGYVTQASRAVYMLETREVMQNPRVLVCHTCDNRECCNPQHLFIGSHADNLGDMRRKGRSNKGEKNGAAKLTEEKVKLARQ